MKLLVIFAYYEESRPEEVHKNYDFFMKHAYYTYIDYIFIINGKCSIDLKRANNIIIFYRENIGFDFGAYTEVLKYLTTEYDYYFFVNSSVRGPFILPSCGCKWYDSFLDLFKSNVKLVGCTIGIYGDNIYVESYAFMLDHEALTYLKDKIFNKMYTNFIECYTKQEFGMTKFILENGWNISSLILEQQNIDYSNLNSDKKYKKYKLENNQLINEGRVCNGRDIHPYEAVFVKTNRPLNKNVIDSLTTYYLEPIEYYRNNPYSI